MRQHGMIRVPRVSSACLIDWDLRSDLESTYCHADVSLRFALLAGGSNVIGLQGAYFGMWRSYGQRRELKDFSRHRAANCIMWTLLSKAVPNRAGTLIYMPI
jgi:hypothetical protein